MFSLMNVHNFQLCIYTVLGGNFKKKKMKTHLTILALILTLISCETKHSETTKETIKLDCGIINIKIDTFDISTVGNFEKVALYHDNFYLVFEKPDSYNGKPKRKIIIIDSIGNKIGKVSVPKDELEDIAYFDFGIENDSLFIKKTHSFSESTFVLDEKESKLKATKVRLLTQYKDNEYFVYVIDRGEFGSGTFFKNMKTLWTGRVNTGCLNSTPAIINKIDSIYYILNSSTFLEGYARILKVNYLKSFKETPFIFDKNQYISNKGVEIALDSARMYMSTSFVKEKKLLCIYTVENKTYLGEILNRNVKQLYEFKFKFSALLNSQLENGKQILSVYFYESKKNGIMTIDKNNIEFHILN